MEYLLLGFFTSLSLILAIGPQNVFVIEQGLKKQYVFLVCLICSISDCILIFVGIFLFHYFSQYFNSLIELLFNIVLLVFLGHFIYSKFKTLNDSITDYMINLNTHKAYSSMRSKRKRDCNQNRLISGYELANWMGNYAITRDEYIKTLRLVIKKNKLDLLDSLI